MKLNLKDIQKYIFPLKRIFSKYRQIRSLEQVKNFVQEQSAQVSQMTLYGYLKTRMGAKHVLMFEDKDFLNSINIAKWHIYAASLVDCTFFCFSYLYKERNFSKTEEANRIFFENLLRTFLSPIHVLANCKKLENSNAWFWRKTGESIG